MSGLGKVCAEVDVPIEITTPTTIDAVKDNCVLKRSFLMSVPHLLVGIAGVECRLFLVAPVNLSFVGHRLIHKREQPRVVLL